MTLHVSSGRWRLGLGLALTTTVLWGVLPIALRISLQAVDVYTIIWFRFGIAFLGVFLILAAQGKLPKFRVLSGRDRRLLAIAALFLALNYGFFMQGLALTSPANAQVLIQLSMVFFGFGALWIYKERYNRWQWLGVGLLITGFSLFFNDQLRVLVTASQPYLMGSAALAIAALAWAVYALAQKQLLQIWSSPSIMMIIYGVCWLMFTPFASPGKLAQLDPLHWGTLIFCAMNTIVAYGAFAESLEHWEASRVSAVLASTPIVTLVAVTTFADLWPQILPHEKISSMGILGALTVVSGSLLISLGKRSKNLEKGTSKNSFSDR